MFSTVGKQTSDQATCKAAVQLQMDCVAAYSMAGRRAHSKQVATRFLDIAARCQRGADAWNDRLQALGAPLAPTSELSARLNEKKVKVASLFGIRAIAVSLWNNGIDRRDGFERVAKRKFSTPTTALAKGMHEQAKQDIDFVAGLMRCRRS